MNSTNALDTKKLTIVLPSFAKYQIGNMVEPENVIYVSKISHDHIYIYLEHENMITELPEMNDGLLYKLGSSTNVVNV